MFKIFVICLFFCTLNANNKNQRIVTVGGSVTEIVFALGSGKSVVAVDWSSRIPSKVSKLPQESQNELFETIDLNNDGVIQYEEFRIQAQITESPLLL